MNKNFVDLVDKLMENSHPAYLNKETNFEKSDRIPNSFFLQPFKVSEVIKYISSLDIHKSSRSDLPRIQFLKMSVEIIAPLITLIFNQCINQDIFPTSFKLAEIIPIHKSGARTVINNYRPISLLSPF